MHTVNVFTGNNGDKIFIPSLTLNDIKMIIYFGYLDTNIAISNLFKYMYI